MKKDIETVKGSVNGIAKHVAENNMKIDKSLKNNTEQLEEVQAGMLE